MKIKPEIVTEIKRAIQDRHPKADTLNYHYTCYQKRDPAIPRIELAKDLDKRFRWDLIHDARILFLYENSIDPERYAAYPYHKIIAVGSDVNDAHIDTALKQVVKLLGVIKAV